MWSAVASIVFTACHVSCLNAEFFLETKNISELMGIVQSPNFDSPKPQDLPKVDLWATFAVPFGHVTLVSFIYMSTSSSCSRAWHDITLYKGGKSSTDVLWTTCGYPVPLPNVYEADIMHLRLNKKKYPTRPEFQILYSFHQSVFPCCLSLCPVSGTEGVKLQRPRQPTRVISGLWNCSTPGWPDFERHFLCNVETECEAGEDEAPCFYTGHCGQDYLTLNGRCYSYRKSTNRLSTWRSSSIDCQQRGGYLVSLNTPGEWQAVVDVLRSRVFTMAVSVGISQTASVVPSMYKLTNMWEDKTVAFYLDIDQLPNTCGKFDDLKYNTMLIIKFPCHMAMHEKEFICEFDTLLSVDEGELKSIEKHPDFHTLQNVSFLVPVVTCPAGHLTFTFLACDEQSACWFSRHGYGESKVGGVPSRTACLAPLKSLPVMFECSSGLKRVPYSLVCDHRQQCVDNSDESFCVFPPCSGPTPLTCAGSTQCVRPQSSCNGQADCINGADELQCAFSLSGKKKTLPPPAVVNFPTLTLDTASDLLSFVITPLPEEGQTPDDPSPCPETHFQCQPYGYCLPVFVRCNGMNDCPGREDEAGCDSVMCPGFYLCRSSSVCLHPSHVCDGVYQCPQQDDELFCNVACPPGCTCQGLAFTCLEPVHGERHTDVRYLDASGSGMTPAELTDNDMLIHLSLSRCRLDSLHNMSFPNLRSLDISHNRLSIFTTEHLRGMMNLQYLILSSNPLKSLFPLSINQSAFSVLETLDLSGVFIKRLNPGIFSPFGGLQSLNLSHCGVDTVVGDGFHSISKLRVLDTVGCPLANFPRNLLSKLDQLQAVYAGNFRLCCPETLPAGFNLVNCEAPFDEVSSCKSLLRSDVYTVFLSIFATLTLIGNFGCFMLRSFFLKSSTSGFVVFVTHLSVSDFLMGVYLAVIGVADRQYKGNYQWKDFSWRHSTACQLAGFLSLMSNEVSAFIICLITLDRFLVLRFPFSSVHFKARSAHLTCLAVWVVAVTISVIPLSPVTSHWSFYSHTGICIPLPVTRGDFAGRQYAFGVLIVCNFILFVLIALGQAAIYVSVRANSLSTTDSTNKSNDLRLARRLISVAVSDFLCWFPVGLLGLLASSGVPISGEVNVAMAILVLPLNSAINPFLYTINVIMERRRRSRDEKLLEQLTRQMCNEERTLGRKQT